MTDKKQISLNIIAVLINAKANTVSHTYAAQWLLESLIQVLKIQKTTHTQFCVPEWYRREREKQVDAHKPTLIDHQHLEELLALCNTMSDWWQPGEMIANLEAMV